MSQHEFQFKFWLCCCAEKEVTQSYYYFYFVIHYSHEWDYMLCVLLAYPQIWKWSWGPQHSHLLAIVDICHVF